MLLPVLLLLVQGRLLPLLSLGRATAAPSSTTSSSSQISLLLLALLLVLLRVLLPLLLVTTGCTHATAATAHDTDTAVSYYWFDCGC
jgi:hypothetical protein